MELQKQIVSEFDKIENALKVVENFLIASDEHIKNKFDEMFSNTANLQPLMKLFDVIETGSRPQGGVSHYEEGAYSLGGEHINNTTGYLNLKNEKFIPMEFYDAANSGHIEKNDILLCKDGALTGKVAIVRNELNNVKALANEHIFVMKNSNFALQWYLFYYLFFEEGQQKIKSNITGMAQGGINRSNLQKIEIPLPSIEEQKKFAEYVQSIEEQKNEAISRKNDLIAQREDIINKYFNEEIRTFKLREMDLEDGTLYELSDGNIFDVSIGNRVLSSEIVDNGKYPVYSANVFEPFGRIDKLNRNDFSKPSIIWGIDGDWQVNLIEANQPFYPTDHCGVIRINTDEILPKYLMIALRIKGEQERFSRSNRASINRIQNLSLNIPPLDIQNKIIDEFNEIELKIKTEEDLLIDSDESVKSKFDEMFKNVKDTISIDECCYIQKGDPLTRKEAIAGDVPVIAGGMTPSCYHNSANRPANVITISASGNAGYLNFWRIPIFASDCNTLQSKNDFVIEFIYQALKNQQDEIYALKRGALQPHVYGTDIAKLKIPNPPIEEQRKFAEYVQSIEEQKNEAINRKESLIAQRDQIINKYFQ